ncbi:putative Ig domain-containing protein [bacterium]|nr:putative Ig domain-containing protein [bacterium]
MRRWAAFGAPTISDFDVNPTTVSLGDSFTATVTTSPDVVMGVLFLDFRPTLPMFFPLPLTFDGTNWTVTSPFPGIPFPVGVDSFEMTMRATVYDAASDTDTQSDTITVSNNVNDPPVITSSPLTTATEDDLYSYDVDATDPDVGDVLAYSLTTSPAGMMIDAATGLIEWTPTNEQVGDNGVVVQVTDLAGATGTQPFTITVANVNDPPVITSTPVTTATEDTLYSYVVVATDPDVGDILTFSLPTFPAGMTIDSSTGLITWTPTNAQVGDNPVSVRVEDAGGLFDTQSFTVTVANVNEAPSITSTAVTTAIEGQLYSYDVDADDPDVGDTLTFALDTNPTGMSINSSTGLIEWTPTNAQVGDNPVIVRVEDSGGLFDTQNFTITVEAAVNYPPTVSISATPSIIAQGESATLSWSSTNAQNAHIDKSIGVVAVNDSTVVSPNHTTIYTITAIGTGGSANAQAVVTVLGNPEPQPEGSFGEQYDDLVPADATVASYDPRRFSLITGLVHDLAAVPIADVAITILNHPEYGTTFTDIEGRFSIPVEGGTTMTVVYQQDGLLTAQRKVDVPWNDIAIAEIVQMLAEDPASTTLTFDGDSETVVTHQSTEFMDEFGSRSCSMVFTGDNKAYLVDKNGSDIQELTTITTRATEYVTENSMPAKLPPNSAYTYCAELAVDGAQRVRFDKPVVTWVHNFLGFDVGEIVPVGYYDRDRGVWVPSDNGVVVKLLDTEPDGIVDALDADGDEQPDDLNDNQSFSDEVTGLSDSQRYPPGSTFWRVPVTHFSPYDFNWPWGPPEDAIPPNPEGEPDVDDQEDEILSCPINMNSFVEARSRVFHEDIPIPGTDITLHYASNRIEGYKSRITVPASGQGVPGSLMSIVVNVKVAGRLLSQSLPPLPYQKATFIWDGLDHLGRLVSMPTTAKVSIGFVYELVYYTAPIDFARAFGRAGTNFTVIRGRQIVIFWKHSSVAVNPREQITKGGGLIAEGWTLSSHHNVSPMAPTIFHKGDGSLVKYDAKIIEIVAGNGFNGYSGGDGGPATEASFNYPSDVAIDSLGNLYIADYLNHRIRKVDTSGIITTVAGDGSRGYSGDGGPATEARLYYPIGVAVDSLGNLYIADGWNQRIRKVDTSGILTIVAGGNGRGYSGDGGPATGARLSRPGGVAIDSLRNLYITDNANHRVRKVGPPSTLASAWTLGDIPFAEENGLGHIMSSAGRHKTTIDLDTGVTLYEFGYNGENELVSITDRFSNQITINRDANGVPTSIVSPDGITTTLTIDANNHLTRITSDGNFHNFEYTSDGLMTAKIEPEGNRFENTFDANGKLTDATDEEEGHWNYSRFTDASGDILTEVTTGEGNITSYLDHTYSTGKYTSTITDATGAQTLFTQSADGLTVNKSLPCGMALAFKYDVDPEYKFKYVKEMSKSTPFPLTRATLRDKTYQDTNEDEIPDLITETVTVNGKATTLEHNTLLSQQTVTSPEGRTVTSLYDADTLLTTNLIIPGLHETTYGYDVRGRLTSILTNTRETSFTYNAQGFLESITDPEGYFTTYDYDTVGRMTAIHRPDSTTVGFAYDKNGNMTVLTNPSLVGHGFGYNKVNLNGTYQAPISGSYSYVYDKDRRLVQTNFPSGKQINNIYDTIRLDQIQTPEGDIDFTYFCGTKVESIDNGTDVITYGYDGSLITSETLNGTLNQILSYTYNNDFNLQSFTYAGDEVSYAYDNDGLLIGAGDFAITRNAGNGLPEAVTGGSLNLSRAFSGYGEVQVQDFTVNSSSLTSWVLGRDDNGRIVQKIETVDGATANYVYTYDPMGRLLTVIKDSALVEDYQYDANGTRISEVNTLRGIAGRGFAYSDEDHLLTAGDATYQYDLDGFLTTKTQGTDVTTYDYSSRGELLSVSLPDGKFIEHIHDALGRRIAKKVNSVTVEKYLWQGLTRLLAVYDGGDNLLMRFEYADGRMPVAMTKGGFTYYLTYDQVGSLRVVADAAGNVVKRIDYDSFGNIINDTDPAFEAPFGFAGGLHDRDTGLVRFGFRDYDPDVGRWTAKDPILFAGGDMDLYGYCINNPVTFIDLDGTEIEKVGEQVYTGVSILDYVKAVFDYIKLALGFKKLGDTVSEGNDATAEMVRYMRGDLTACPEKAAERAQKAERETIIATGAVIKQASRTLGTTSGGLLGFMPPGVQLAPK